MESPFLLFQLADAAFPAGGFAHSSGLEAALAFGGAESVDSFLEGVLLTTARASLPFVRAACREPSRLAELDAAYDATLLFSVANRASRAQGRALAMAASRVWEAAAFLAEYAGPVHHAPIFGALSGALRIAADDACAMHLHGTARNVLSAAVRLGVIGPLEAQRLHAETDLSSFARRVVHVDDAANASPILELHAQLHERLDGRLFQS